MKKARRLLALVLAVMLVVGLFATQVSAQMNALKHDKDNGTYVFSHFTYGTGLTNAVTVNACSRYGSPHSHGYKSRTPVLVCPFCGDTITDTSGTTSVYWCTGIGAEYP